ncbi:hypothetical protein Ahy_A07g033161 [Arachis hypogaea]|uniref:RNase H type-1 domain-containing protein n=1 Tax=Arachis hypogaea TaxID=3818 RepID=A0A445C8N1_ARAHY|nr:hypothetical protein Ahy_A07g033161 [Arachis hypogaea]
MGGELQTKELKNQRIARKEKELISAEVQPEWHWKYREPVREKIGTTDYKQKENQGTGEEVAYYVELASDEENGEGAAEENVKEIARWKIVLIKNMDERLQLKKKREKDTLKLIMNEEWKEKETKRENQVPKKQKIAEQMKGKLEDEKCYLEGSTKGLVENQCGCKLQKIYQEGSNCNTTEIRAFSSLEAEALALKEALIMEKSLQLEKVLIESNNLQLIQSIKSKYHIGEILAYLKDIAHLLKDLPDARIIWTPGEKNHLAHHIATQRAAGTLSSNWSVRLPVITETQLRREAKKVRRIGERPTHHEGAIEQNENWVLTVPNQVVIEVRERTGRGQQTEEQPAFEPEESHKQVQN